jgi:hypothetical protein
MVKTTDLRSRAHEIHSTTPELSPPQWQFSSQQFLPQHDYATPRRIQRATVDIKSIFDWIHLASQQEDHFASAGY